MSTTKGSLATQGSIKDSPGDDKFVGRSTYGKLRGPGFKVQAQWFDAVEACANSTGDDRAYLFDSPGDDWFIGDSKGAVMQGVGFRNTARWFETAYGYGTGGGMDRAVFYDSSGSRRPSPDRGSSSYSQGYVRGLPCSLLPDPSLELAVRLLRPDGGEYPS